MSENQEQFRFALIELHVTNMEKDCQTHTRVYSSDALVLCKIIRDLIKTIEEEKK